MSMGWTRDVQLKYIDLYNEFIRYDNGKLYWKKRPSPRAHMDSPIGGLDGGYLKFRFRGKTHRVHRVVWLIHNGPIPEGYEVDHLYHDKLDNRVEMLRCIPKLDNGRNQPIHSHNTSGVTGVNWMSSMGKWRAEIRMMGKTNYLRCFDNKEEAIDARKKAEQLHGFHPNHGK